MAQVIINIPDDKAADIRDTIATHYGWSESLGITKAAFLKRLLADYIKAMYTEAKANEAAAQMRLNNKSLDIN
jgi:hypothetical protein